MAAPVIAPPPPETDHEFFLDRRRALRFRLAHASEPAGWGILAHRDGRRWGWPVASGAAFQANAHPYLLELILAAVAQVRGLEMQTAGNTVPAA